MCNEAQCLDAFVQFQLQKCLACTSWLPNIPNIRFCILHVCLQDHLTDMRWDTCSKNTLEWDNVIPRPQGKLIMQAGAVSGKRDTMQGILTGTAEPTSSPAHPHKADPVSADMYAIMASQVPSPHNTVPTAAVIHRKRVVRPVPGEEHTPVFQERYAAWLGKPRQDMAEKPQGLLAGATHPVNRQPDSVWH